MTIHTLTDTIHKIRASSKEKPTLKSHILKYIIIKSMIGHNPSAIKITDKAKINKNIDAKSIEDYNSSRRIFLNTKWVLT
jgi:predicted metal-binding transcription factor (methanogenesis marker protein 9)